MLVGFFGCCGAVKESQCLLGSVSTNWTRWLDVVGNICDVCFFFFLSLVLCLPARHFRHRGGSWGVWLFEQRQGTFVSLLHAVVMGVKALALVYLLVCLLCADHRGCSELLCDEIQREQ